MSDKMKLGMWCVVLGLMMTGCNPEIKPVSREGKLTKKQYREVKTVELQQAFKTVPPWKVTVYEDVLAKDYAPTSSDADPEAVKICFWRTQAERMARCTDMVDKLKDDKGRGDVIYKFTNMLSLTITPVTQQGGVAQLVLVTRRRFVTDVLDRVNIWTYDAAREQFINALDPPIRITVDGEYKLFSDLDGKAVAVGARSIIRWLEEGHFGLHQYRISLYRYEGTKYRKIGSYATRKKYNSEDMMSPGANAGVIQQEMVEIRKMLKAQP